MLLNVRVPLRHCAVDEMLVPCGALVAEVWSAVCHRMTLPW